jgi:hypothetical protein
MGRNHLSVSSSTMHLRSPSCGRAGEDEGRPPSPLAAMARMGPQMASLHVDSSPALSSSSGPASSANLEKQFEQLVQCQQQAILNEQQAAQQQQVLVLLAAQQQQHRVADVQIAAPNTSTSSPGSSQSTVTLQQQLEFMMIQNQQQAAQHAYQQQQILALLTNQQQQYSALEAKFQALILSSIVHPVAHFASAPPFESVSTHSPCAAAAAGADPEKKEEIVSIAQEFDIRA